MAFTLYRQLDAMDCGPTCLKMVAKHYGRNISLRTLSHLCEFSRHGVSLLGLHDASQKIGFQSAGVKLSIEDIKSVQLPIILHWKNYHFVVLFKIKRNKFVIADPANGILKLGVTDFIKNWQSDDKASDNKERVGIALVLEPQEAFFAKVFEETENSPKSSSIFSFLEQHKKMLFQLMLGMLLGSVFQLLLPLLTQSIVDYGIVAKNLRYIELVLFAQLAITVGKLSSEYIRSWILLHISTRIDISILSRFLSRLLVLPMSFFETKMTGDIMQRIYDHKSIQNFLTGPTISSIFSIASLIAYSIALIYYDYLVFTIFLIFSVLHTAWIIVFMGKRKELNYKGFGLSVRNQTLLIQLITGMQEMKMNICDYQKRWEWQRLQAKSFRYSTQVLKIDQFQQAGVAIITEGKNLFITLVSALAVVKGDLTLGGMLAIQFVAGQLNAPFDQLLTFVKAYQDAKIALTRLTEIDQIESEQTTLQNRVFVPGDLTFNNVTFKYPGAGNETILNNLSFTIPYGKVTAIVGKSGSGKTTILKLLLRYYKLYTGTIELNGQNLDTVDYRAWRRACGVVLQEGFIFSDSIERNIAVGTDLISEKKVNHAIRMASLSSFVSSLKDTSKTIIGSRGVGVSQGQRQRILIARAIYKSPLYLLLDEATNALDSTNELSIIENLTEHFAGRTVVIVAHRLSTIKHADNIIVLNEGCVAEQGTHVELLSKKGHYYHLTKSQLDLHLQ